MDKFSWIKRNLYLIIIIVVAVYLIIDLNTRLSTLNFLEDQEQTLEADVDNLQSTLDTVNDRIDYSNSDTAVEEWARQQGLMRQEDDHVILPLPGEYETPTPTAVPEVEVTQAPNWSIWQSLIFD
jgi:cell division protein FtsL